MKQHLVALIFLLNLSVFQAQSERIISFHSDIEIDTSGTIIVKETIKVYATGSIFKRGITRTLPIVRIDSSGNRATTDFKIISVERDGSASKYHSKKGNGTVTIYIGESDVFLRQGEYTYTISYEMNNQIRFFNDFDEVYWNVNGFDWALPFGQISSKITLPDNGKIIQHACYTGIYGSTNQNCSASLSTENSITYTANNLRAGENLTIAIGINKGVVNEPSPPPPPTFLQKFGSLILSGLLSLFLLFYYGITWLKFGIDPKKPTVYPHFEIPEQMTPASIGMLDKQRYFGDLITGTILNLAVNGYLKIEEDNKAYVFGLFKNKKFILHKLKEDDGALKNEEKVLLDKLFYWDSTVVLDGEYDSKIKSAVSAFRKSLGKQHFSLIYQGLNLKFWIAPILMIIAYVFLFIFLSSNYLKGENDGVIFTSFLVSNIIFFLVYQYLIRKPAVEKLRLKSLIDGFKMYMNAAENRQIAHFNPPDLTPEIFEKYLPYAVVLGAEDVWGEKFQNLINSSLVNQDYQPIWYSGRVTNFATFNHTLNSSLSNSISSSATPPSSSGSGSGGGGFSGGGGGGGGGGGW